MTEERQLLVILDFGSGDRRAPGPPAVPPVSVSSKPARPFMPVVASCSCRPDSNRRKSSTRLPGRVSWAVAGIPGSVSVSGSTRCCTGARALGRHSAACLDLCRPSDGPRQSRGTTKHSLPPSDGSMRSSDRPETDRCPKQQSSRRPKRTSRQPPSCRPTALARGPACMAAVTGPLPRRRSSLPCWPPSGPRANMLARTLHVSPLGIRCPSGEVQPCRRWDGSRRWHEPGKSAGP